MDYDAIVRADIGIAIINRARGLISARLHDIGYGDPAEAELLRLRRRVLLALELADMETTDYGEGGAGVWTRGLLIRRHIADGELAFFTTWCPAGTEIDALVQVEGHR